MNLRQLTRLFVLGSIKEVVFGRDRRDNSLCDEHHEPDCHAEGPYQCNLRDLDVRRRSCPTTSV